MKPKLPTPIGLRSGRLRVVGDAPDRNGQRYYACVCDCGNATEHNAQNIKRGLAKSCGCLARESSGAFFAHIGPRPASPGGRRSPYSLDRIDGNRGYEPGNVRWATMREQNANRRPRSEWKNA